MLLKLAVAIALLASAIAVPISTVPVNQGDPPPLTLLYSPAPLPAVLPESLITEEFRDFMATYGRSYESVEEMLHRARVFATNLAHIKAVNANPANTWTAAVNKLADKTTEEIAQLKVRRCHLTKRLTLVSALKCAAGLPPRHVPISSFSS
jgi:hypothetical protein